MMNLTTYKDRSVVGYYAKLEGLFPPEEAIFQLVSSDLGEVDMLDIGVGAGRTTLQLAGRCRSYVGLDYSATMVEQARTASGGKHSILHADARDMKEVASESADFVLFSFNGIDYVSHADRLKILREIRRICRPGAWFAFSTHNLAGGRKEFGWSGGGLKGLVKYLLKQLLNFPLPLRLRGDYAILNDGWHRFRLRTYYVQPKEQLRQLADVGFKSVRVFEGASGRELAADDPQDAHAYYLCRAH
jgi:SAM-dependent methyltransferase